MNKTGMHNFGKLAKTLLAVVGACALLMLLAYGALRAWQDTTPDSVKEVISPDGQYRLVSTEDLVGFPGQACVKSIYILKTGEQLNVRDQTDRIFSGACDGMVAIKWNSKGVEGTVNVAKAVDGVAGLMVKEYAVRGKVRVTWSAM